MHRHPFLSDLRVLAADAPSPRRRRVLRSLALGILYGSLLLVTQGTAHADPAPKAPASQAEAPVDEEPCQEDEPCWDCESMGNLVCGTDTLTDEPAADPSGQPSVSETPLSECGNLTPSECATEMLSSLTDNGEGDTPECPDPYNGYCTVEVDVEAAGEHVEAQPQPRTELPRTGASLDLLYLGVMLTTLGLVLRWTTGPPL